MRRIHLATVLLLALAAMASDAAADNPFYLLGKLGNSTLDDDLGTSLGQIFDGDDESFGLGLGFRFGKYLAVQAEYQDLGSIPGFGTPCPPGEPCIEILVPLEADNTAISVTALPQWPISDRFFVYGKFGFVSWESDVSEALDAGERFIDDLDDEELIYGAGLRLLLPGPFGVFAEYELIADTFEILSVGVTWGF